ncbi:hypothetical protein [Nocardioides sp.]|uniref:hypothetical protein n=1 Tax=Nocardioides sp. TaxID=35761 RepID=UPI0035283BF9
MAGELEVLEDLRAAVAVGDPSLAAGLVVAAHGDGLSVLEGSWSSRQWVPLVTAYLAGGGCQVLVGTRALLGEGWDAPCVTGLVDLTAATTATSVVQTRGRALRLDPTWPEKVAVTWSVVCVAEQHPKGDNDWQRLVRKHEGFFALDGEGEIVDGVAHLDDSFSPFAAPAAREFGEVNARMVARSTGRATLAAGWRVGEPYDDHVARTVRVLPDRPREWGTDQQPPAVRVGPTRVPARRGPLAAAVMGVGAASAGVGAVVAAGYPPVVVAAATGVLAAVTTLGGLREVRRGRRLVAEAGRRPSIRQVANAVADGLREAGLATRGAEAVSVWLDAEGVYRCSLEHVDEAASRLFGEALEEALGPVADQRYLVPRWVILDGDASVGRALRAAAGLLAPDGEVWHPVPSALGVNARRAQGYARAWQHWVGGGEALYTGSPEGAGVVAAQLGDDPFAVTSVMRRHWS